MVSLLAFRQRIWSLFSPNNLELNPNTVTSINKIQQSIKRKLSFSPDHDLEPALKKLEAGNADMRLKIGLKGGYLETTVSQDKLNIRAIGDTRERRWNEPARISAPKREKFADELKREKEDLIEEYKIEAVDHITTDDDDFKDWSQQELDFFNGLNDRGVVPMLWSYWKIDFPTLPEILFTSDKEEAIIKNWNGSAASGARALNTLIQAGNYARERQESGQNAAQLLARELNNYIKWSYRDAKLDSDDYIPLIIVNFALKNEDLETTNARTQDRVRELGDQYLQLWGDAEPKFESSPPTIFHIFIARTVMGFGSYDTSAKQPEFRNIFFTDWKQRGHDLWNAMAIALLVSQTRTWLAKVDPRNPAGRKTPEPDPDL